MVINLNYRKILHSKLCCMKHLVLILTQRLIFRIKSCNFTPEHNWKNWQSSNSKNRCSLSACHWFSILSIWRWTPGHMFPRPNHQSLEDPRTRTQSKSELSRAYTPWATTKSGDSQLASCSPSCADQQLSYCCDNVGCDQVSWHMVMVKSWRPGAKFVLATIRY